MPASKLYLGFEPGEQAGGGAWEGQDADLKWAADAKAAGLAGTFVWAINPDAGSAGAAAAPKLAATLKQATGAGWPARSAPCHRRPRRRKISALPTSKPCHASAPTEIP